VCGFRGANGVVMDLELSMVEAVALCGDVLFCIYDGDEAGGELRE